ncbi:MAG: hypothetical protein HYU27_05250 [Acidobacteria bacterium]|nr:hypothetical protein [Acidobacteriota bacterium]
MRIHFLGSIGTMAAVAVVLFLACALAIGQSATPAPDIPRLSDGRPDFSGVWARPRVGNITQDGKGCGSGVSGCTQKGSGELSFTPVGAQLMKAPKFDHTAFCLPWGYTRAMQTEYPIEIVQNAKRLAILYESNNIFHVVPTDGRQHPQEIEPGWMGKSIGRYEGDTLVIDTKGFNGKIHLDVGPLHPTSDAMHIIERLSYIDANRVTYEITIEDPKIYTKPIKNYRTWVRMKPGEELMEYWCMENNKDLLDGHLDHFRQEEAFKKFFEID